MKKEAELSIIIVLLLTAVLAAYFWLFIRENEVSRYSPAPAAKTETGLRIDRFR